MKNDIGFLDQAEGLMGGKVPGMDPVEGGTKSNSDDDDANALLIKQA